MQINMYPQIWTHNTDASLSITKPELIFNFSKHVSDFRWYLEVRGAHFVVIIKMQFMHVSVK